MECGITLKAAIADALAISDHKSQEFATKRPDIVEAFRQHKLTFGNRIEECTFEASYGRDLNVALLHLRVSMAAQTGKQLTERVLSHQRVNQKPGIKQGEELTPWIEMPKSRLECCLALKKFLEYAVAEHRQPQSYLISEKDYLELRGADGKSRKKAVLTDAEVLELIQLLQEIWTNAIKICHASCNPYERETQHLSPWERQPTPVMESRKRRSTAVLRLMPSMGATSAWRRDWITPVAAQRVWEEPRCPATLVPLAAANGRIRGKRRVAAAVLTAGHVLRPGSRDRERRHPDRRGHGAYGRGSSPQLPNFRMAKRSESLREGELMKRLLTLNHVQNL